MPQGSYALTSSSSEIPFIAWTFTNLVHSSEDSRRPSEKFAKHEAARRQYLRTENVLVEWQRTQENLPLLQEAAERDDMYSIQAASGSKNELIQATSRKSSALVKSQNNSLAVIEAAAAAATGSESDKRALVLRNTKEWLEMLLEDWTVLSQEPLNGREAADTAWRRAPPSEERRISRRPRSTDGSKNIESLSAAEIERGLDNTGERNRRFIPETARRREQRRPSEWQGDFPKKQTRAPANDFYEPSNQQAFPSSEKREFQSDGIASGESGTRLGGSGGPAKMKYNRRDVNRQRDAPSRYQHVDDDIGDRGLQATSSRSLPHREQSSQSKGRPRRPAIDSRATRVDPLQPASFDLFSTSAANPDIFNFLDPTQRTQRESEIPIIDWTDIPDPGPLPDVIPVNRRRALIQPVKAINGRYFFECPEENCDRIGEQAFLNWQDLEGHLDLYHAVRFFTNDGRPIADERHGSSLRHFG